MRARARLVALVFVALSASGCGNDYEGSIVNCATDADGTCSCTWDAPTYLLSPDALAPQCEETDEPRCCAFVDDLWEPHGAANQSTCACKPLAPGQSCEPQTPWIRVEDCPPGYVPNPDGSHAEASDR